MVIFGKNLCDNPQVAASSIADDCPELDSKTSHICLTSYRLELPVTHIKRGLAEEHVI